MELRDFAKIALQPGEKRTVTFTITREQLAFHNIDMNYAVEPGDFDLMVGTSSAEVQMVKLTVDRRIDLLDYCLDRS